MVAELHQQRRKSKDSIDGSPTRSNIRRLSSSSQGRRTSVSSHDRRMSVSSQERILASKSQEQLASEDSYEGQASPCLSTQEREMSTVSDDCSFLQDTRRPSTASTSSEGLSVRVPVIRRSSLRTPQELRLQNNSGFPIELGIPLQDMRRRPSLPALGMHSAEDTLIQNHDDKRRASKPASLLKFLKKKLANWNLEELSLSGGMRVNVVFAQPLSDEFHTSLMTSYSYQYNTASPFTDLLLCTVIIDSVGYSGQHRYNFQQWLWARSHIIWPFYC